TMTIFSEVLKYLYNLSIDEILSESETRDKSPAAKAGETLAAWAPTYFSSMIKVDVEFSVSQRNFLTNIRKIPIAEMDSKTNDVDVMRVISEGLNAKGTPDKKTPPGLISMVKQFRKDNGKGENDGTVVSGLTVLPSHAVEL